jgi:peptidyl-prolyl cis-trans isomerase SurA
MKHVKHLCMALMALALVTALRAQPLFTYGGDAVGKEEFLRAFNKNKNAEETNNQTAAIKEYLDLYIRFKLKVKAAATQRLDTLETLRADVSNFRNQVQESYMNDEKGVAALVGEAYERSQKDLRVWHFFVPNDAKGGGNDMATIEKVYNELKGGKMDYQDAAGKPVANYNGGRCRDLGFVTAFLLPYTYENLIYGLQPGGVSKPYQSKTGWHVFKVTEERKSAGKWRVAQILLAFPPEGVEYDKASYAAKADSIYNELKKGGDFANMAREVSQDKLTYLNGGEMPEFGTGKYEAAFENAVFKLGKDGEIGRPFATALGYHIVKRLGHTPTPMGKSDAGLLYETKQKVLQDDRVSGARARFVKDVVKKVGYKRNPAVPDAQLFRFADSMTPQKSVEAAQKTPISKKPVFTVGKTVVKGGDWLHFVHDYKSSELYKEEPNSDLLDKYVEATSLEYYKKNLELYNADFKYQMQEFKEGNMLFEIMERNIWSRAAADSMGLKKLYDGRRQQYIWPASADILIFNCSNEATAKKAAEQLQAGMSWKAIADSSNGTIQADSARYEQAQMPVPEGTAIAAGLVSAPLVNATDGMATFIKVIRTYPAGQQRSFEEAKGLVINDYQAYLEEQWIAELKKKYPVKVNETVLKGL